MERKIKKKFYRPKWGKQGARCQILFTGGGSHVEYGKNANLLNSLPVGSVISFSPGKSSS